MSPVLRRRGMRVDHGVASVTPLELAQQALHRASQRLATVPMTPSEIIEMREREPIIARALLELSEAVEEVLTSQETPWDALMAAQERAGR
jgi:hypothetical protein